MQQHVAVRVSNGMGKSFPQLKKIMACLLYSRRLRGLGMAPNSQTMAAAVKKYGDPVCQFLRSISFLGRGLFRHIIAIR